MCPECHHAHEYLSTDLEAARMICEVRDRLNRAYLEATTTIFVAGKAIPNMTSAKWKEATLKARALCKTALADLNRHKKEHGC
jgi:hypothetical protein